MRKRGAPIEDEETERREQELAWRKRAKTRILSNALPAGAVQADLQSAQGAGARGCEDILSARASNKNASRDLMNKMLRENEWPGLYWAEIPTADFSTGQCKQTWVPFLLPHEWLPLYTRWHESFLDLEPEEDYMQNVRQEMAETLKTDPTRMVLVGNF